MEDFIGEFRRQLASRSGQKELEKSQAFTKWVPEPRKVTLPLVEQSIDRSIRRMNVERLDLVQFHWWEYSNMGWLDALIHLSELRDRGKIGHVGLTNFDTDHMQDMADAGLKIASNQVQYSIIDRRPEVKMAAKEIGRLDDGQSRTMEMSYQLKISEIPASAVNKIMANLDHGTSPMLTVNITNLDYEKF